MNILGWIAFALTIIGLALNARKNIFCWPIWIIGNIVWICGYIPEKDYPIIASNVAYLAINAYGWISWYKKK